MCEEDSAPSHPFFHNLSQINLDIVILEYGNDTVCLPTWLFKGIVHFEINF